MCSPLPTLTNASNVLFVSGYSIPVNGSIRFSASGSDYIVRGFFHRANYSYVTAVLATRHAAAGLPRKSPIKPLQPSSSDEFNSCKY